MQKNKNRHKYLIYIQSALIAILFCCCCMVQFVYAQPVIGTKHNHSLWQLDNTALLFDYHKLTVGENRQFFTYPRRNGDFIRNFAESERGALIYYADSLAGVSPVRHLGVAVSPVAGLYYHDGNGLAQGNSDRFGSEAGLYLRGYADSLDFDLDARAYSGERSADAAEEYVRYRGHLGFNYAWFRASLARDVLHWGPGYYNNLAFNQNALPYSMVNVDITFGPLHVFSVYTSLYENNAGGDKINRRNLYAHRYELALGDLTLGVTEIQVLYGENKPWLFTPIIPLFIEKGNYTESVNNGAFAVDMNYRIFRLARIYGEFLLDDMVSPMALYENEYSNNRWAGMLGMQVVHDVYVGRRLLQLGSVAEIARVEPYTYCHYDYAPALMAHQRLPLGNPNGPNSLAVDWTVYGKIGMGGAKFLFAGLHNKWLWKGSGNGSNIYDPYKTVRKRFIHDAPLQYTLTTMLTYRGERFSVSGEYSFFGEKNVGVRVSGMM